MSIHPILVALAEFESGKAPSPTPPRRFAKHNAWMASEVLLPLVSQRIPGLLLKDMMGLLSGWKHGSLLASAATAIQLKDDMSRIRAFYLPVAGREGRCVKIVSGAPGDAIAERTRNELALRRKLESFGSITVPCITCVEEDKNFIYITEELVIGRRFSIWLDSELFVKQGLPELVATYKLHGIEAVPLLSCFPADLVDKLGVIAEAEPDYRSLLHAVERIYASNPDIPVSRCHGDLLPSNLGVAHGRLYFFDWEKSFHGAIITDLMRLPMKYPNWSRKILAAIFEVLQADTAIGAHSLPQQFTVDVAARIVKNPAKAKQFLRVWQRANYV